MMHRSTRQVVDDLRRHGKLLECDEPLSPFLEIAEVQRRVYLRGGPAVLFTRPSGTGFPMVSNLFGSLEQSRFIFRSTIERVRRAIELKIDPKQLMVNPLRYISAPWTAWTMLPKSVRRGPVGKNAIKLRDLPQLVSWPNDGGAFVTLPQVLSQSRHGDLSSCNLGMYRVQISGNQYTPDEEIGLHYQLHRGIGVHHQAALAANKPFRVSIGVGGTPAMTLAAVMPLPEGLSELTFAGALAGHRIPIVSSENEAPYYADADFVIHGEVMAGSLKPEGPFGDHLGYYSLQHDYPWLRVKQVLHRDGAIWPFTVVGRPPQEDTTFGELIHEITGPVVPTVLPGVKAVHAVDAAGVHPLLLAIGSERYTPYQKPNRPQELLTQANAILGQGQMSLAKYLLILDGTELPELDIHHIDEFFQQMLIRLDWTRDLHFQTRTTIDTLDYSGSGINQGSKVVWAAGGPPKRTLAKTISSSMEFPDGISNPRVCLPGVLAIESRLETTALCEKFAQVRWAGGKADKGSEEFPLIVVVDNAEFASGSLNNFLWVTFTRSNPASDIHGVLPFVDCKHWGCHGSLVIDARIKPHHAPPVVESEEVSRKIDALASRGGPLAKYL